MFCFVLNVTVLGILFSNNNHEFHTFNADIQHTYKNGTIFLFSDGAKKNIYVALKNLHAEPIELSVDSFELPNVHMRAKLNPGEILQCDHVTLYKNMPPISLNFKVLDKGRIAGRKFLMFSFL